MNHRAHELRACLVTAALTLAAMVVLVFALSGCGRQDDAQFAPTKPLVGHFAVRGESMLPTLPTAHVAQVDVAYPFGQLEVGDIVLFWDYHREGFTLHRIVARQGAWFIVQGDNPTTNPDADRPFLTRANYVGRFMSSIP